MRRVRRLTAATIARKTAASAAPHSQASASIAASYARKKALTPPALFAGTELADRSARIEEHLAQLLDLGRGRLQIVGHEFPVRILEIAKVFPAGFALQLDHLGAGLLHLLQLAL